MLFNLRLASSSMHQMARILNWKYAINANVVQSARNYVAQNRQFECNFISAQLKNVNSAEILQMKSMPMKNILFFFRSRRNSAKIRSARI